MGRASGRISSGGLVVCAVGGPRVHLRRSGGDTRSICGLEVRGPQPAYGSAVTCFSCMKKIRDTERPPAPLAAALDMSPVSAPNSETVHLAQRSYPPHFCATKTLCGKPVEALVANGAATVTCLRCVRQSKASA